MKNFDYEKKFHYMVKYFVIAFPLLFYLIFLLIKDYSFFGDLNYFSLIGNFVSALNLNVNSWYFNMVSLIGLDRILFDYTILSLLIVYPLYVFWVYVFDLILDIFVFVPKLAHKLMKKLGG